MYANAKVDKILEDASITIDEKTRIEKYAQFEEHNRTRHAGGLSLQPDLYMWYQKI